jgi:hypothetical protein
VLARGIRDIPVKVHTTTSQSKLRKIANRQSREEKSGGLLELRPPPGTIFPQLKLGQGEATATCTNAPHINLRIKCTELYNSNHHGVKQRNRHRKTMMVTTYGAWVRLT